METSILVLGLLSYVHSKDAYQSIFVWIEKVFQYYSYEIINNESKLVRCRYCLFLGYLVDMLFHKDPQVFRDTIFFLYKNVDLQGEDTAIAL